MADRIHMFYAYPYRPDGLRETIEVAATNISQGSPVEVKTWRELQTTGRLLLETITNAIDDNDIFACDLTYLNHNVLFELGYAIGKSKPLWISLDPDIENSGRRLEMLLQVGYATYSNAGMLTSRFLEDALWDRIGEPTLPLAGSVATSENVSSKVKILYLKTPKRLTIP